MDNRRITVLLTALAAMIAAALLLSACANGDENVAPDAQDPVSVDCDGLDRLRAYRYTVTVELSSPATETAAASATPAPDPLSDLSAVLAGLYSDFTLQGAYVASPGSSQALFLFEGGEIELRSIGERWWVRSGPRWQAADAEAAAVAGDLLTPTVACRKIIAAIVEGLSGTPAAAEVVAGARTDRYHIASSALGDAAPLFGAVSANYTVDLWLAHEGRWPARLLIQSSAGDGQSETFRLSIELSDIGSEDIVVVQPLADY